MSGVSRRGFLVRGVSLLAVGVAAAEKPKTTRFGLTSYQWGKDWNIPRMIENCRKAGVFGVELRTSQKYAHGVELEIGDARRREVRNRFADSPVTLVGIASGERFDAPEPEKVKLAVENAKGYVKLSHDVGASGVRVFVNDFHKEIPREKTIEQVARALNEVGAFAAGYGQQVRLEAHGSAGDLKTVRAIMDRVSERSVRVKLNSDKRDADGPGFEANFNLVKGLLGDTLHLHEIDETVFPYQQQMDLLVRMGWTGWQLLEASANVPDRVQALIQQREIWDRMLAQSMRFQPRA
jgi:hypothetical protein